MFAVGILWINQETRRDREAGAGIPILQSRDSERPSDAGPAPAAAAKTTSGGKEFHGAWPYVLPPKGHYNQFVTDFIMGGGIYDYVVLPPLALYDWANSKFIPYLATEWKNEPGDWFTVKLRDGVKWTDGSDLTSADVVTTFNLARLMGQSVWKYIDKVEAPDKSTVRFHFTSPTSVAPRFILRQTLINPNSVYKEWGDKAAALFAAGKTQDSDEVKALRKDFTEFRPKDLVSSGPYKLDPASVTSSRMDLVKHPQGLFADKVGFDKLVLFNGETPDITPVMMSKDADYATHGFPPATEKAYLDNGIRIIRPPTNSGPALFFNYTDKNLANPAVRQAMAYSIKRDENGAVSLGKSGIASKYLTGFSDNSVPTWLSADDIAKLNQYPYDLKKAEEVMTKAGYKKGSDGFWQDPSGKTQLHSIDLTGYNERVMKTPMARARPAKPRRAPRIKAMTARMRPMVMTTSMPTQPVSHSSPSPSGSREIKLTEATA